MNKISETLDQLCTWDKLFSLGNSKALRSSYIWFFVVPIAAKLLMQFGFPITISIGDRTHVLDVTLPFSWHLFYFSSLFFAAASLVYSFKCPVLIKRFKTFMEYYQDGNGSVLLSKSMSEAEPYIRSSNSVGTLQNAVEIAAMRSGLGAKILEGLIPKKEILAFSGLLPGIKREEYGDIFSLVSSELGKAHRNYRFLLLGLYSIGFTLLFIVFIQNLLSVIQILVK